VDGVAGDYDGEWRRGEKCGFGAQASTLCEGRYVGWWKNGMRWGHGTLNYGSVSRDAAAEKKKREAILRGAAMRAAAAAEGATLSIAGGEGEEDEGEDAAPRGAAAAAHLLGPDVQMEGAAAGKGGGGGGGGGGGKAAAPTNQYAQLLEETASMRYPGDYEYSGPWTAGVPRSGGCFTERRGRPEPHMHRAKPLASGRPVLCPGGFSDLDERECILAEQRWNIAQSSTKLANDNRLAKEALNRQSFQHVVKEADRLLPEVRARNRAAKHDVDRIKQEVQKVAVKFDATAGDAPDEALAVQDVDLQQMAAMEKESEKIAPPLDVRECVPARRPRRRAKRPRATRAPAALTPAPSPPPPFPKTQRPHDLMRRPGAAFCGFCGDGGKRKPSVFFFSLFRFGFPPAAPSNRGSTPTHTQK
jgi:hypothetical protein